MYPFLETKDLTDNLFSDTDVQHPAAFESLEEVVVKIPNSIVHLINNQQSVELASGVFEIIRIRQGGNVVAVLARIGTEVQWSLAKDEAVVKIEGSCYYFNVRVPLLSDDGVEPDDLINYGLTIIGKGSEELDRVLEEYSTFSVKEVDRAVVEGGSPQAKSPKKQSKE
ncbi:hypothetical protein L6452_15917 [Arctium lappa]|uniref:Uncharacterized protein n=1 Tax=Arctium lappa TaxID=4217 RepID=A0ACB9CQD1_ARCLA|nr:hypothetical protein L6452_15917 [Arctium lappa]